jgi:hypothetical protein
MAAGQMFRYVRITWRGGCGSPTDGYLQVAEVQVMYNGYNVALGKTATGSSSLQSSPMFFPAQAVDGRLRSMFHSLTAGTGNFLTIDLQVGSRMACACACAL